MTNEQLEQQAFERGFHNVPEPYQFRRMPGGASGGAKPKARQAVKDR